MILGRRNFGPASTDWPAAGEFSLPPAAAAPAAAEVVCKNMRRFIFYLPSGFPLLLFVSQVSSSDPLFGFVLIEAGTSCLALNWMYPWRKMMECVGRIQAVGLA